ncbi:unnamed protein product, partial [marine sediment metagenome]
MANLFIGFPVPRARIADMIEGSAPPTLHAPQHESGGTDEVEFLKLTDHAHKSEHESGGDDEIDCTDLAGAGGLSEADVLVLIALHAAMPNAHPYFRASIPKYHFHEQKFFDAPSGFDALACSCFDGINVWFGCDDSPAKVIKINTYT